MAWSVPNKLRCLASESQGPVCFSQQIITSPGIIGVYHHTKLLNLGPCVCKAGILPTVTSPSFQSKSC